VVARFGAIVRDFNVEGLVSETLTNSGTPAVRMSRCTQQL